MKLFIAILAIAGVINAQVVPPVGPTDSVCDSVITDPCGGIGQAVCCYSRQLACLNGQIVIANVQYHDYCDTMQQKQRDENCSCPPGCTTGDNGLCV